MINMKEKNKRAIHRFLKANGMGKVTCQVDCIDGTLFLIKKSKQNWIVWIHRNTFDKINRILLDSSLRWGEQALSSLIPGGTVSWSILRRSLPSPPNQNMYYSSSFYSLKLQMIEIQKDGTIGKIAEGIGKITSGLDDAVKKSFSLIGRSQEDVSSTQSNAKPNSNEIKPITALKLQIQDIVYRIMIENTENIERTVKTWLNNMVYNFITFDTNQADIFLKEVKKSKFYVDE